MYVRARLHRFVCYLVNCGKLTAPGWPQGPFAVYQELMRSRLVRPIPGQFPVRVTPRADPAPQKRSLVVDAKPALTMQSAPPALTRDSQAGPHQTYQL